MYKPLLKSLLTIAMLASALLLGGCGAESQNIGIINIDGSNTAIVRADYVINPSWSPNGTKIAYCNATDYNPFNEICGIWSLYIMDADGQNNTPLIEFSAVDCLLGPLWSPDGTKIAYCITTDFVLYQSIWSLCIMDANGQNNIKLTEFQGLSDLSLSWSPDSNKIAFINNADKNMYSIDIYGNNLVQLTDREVREKSPVWSPDGSKIMFEAYDSRRNRDIYTMNADGSSVIRLTDSYGSDGERQWSQDGSKILFTSRRDGYHSIYIMNSDGGGQTRLSDNHSLMPMWSPDETKIVFYTISGNGSNDYEIWVMDSDGGNRINLTNNDYCDRWPYWSPDGTKIAFKSTPNGKSETHIMDTDGSNLTTVPHNGGWLSNPWSPDGSKLVFMETNN